MTVPPTRTHPVASRGSPSQDEYAIGLLNYLSTREPYTLPRATPPTPTPATIASRVPLTAPPGAVVSMNSTPSPVTDRNILVNGQKGAAPTSGAKAPRRMKVGPPAPSGAELMFFAYDLSRVPAERVKQLDASFAEHVVALQSALSTLPATSKYISHLPPNRPTSSDQLPSYEEATCRRAIRS
jgi:hypothetical protein